MADIDSWEWVKILVYIGHFLDKRNIILHILSYKFAKSVQYITLENKFLQYRPVSS